MNIVNLRKDLRRSRETRRVSDRRVAPYQFGSEQWIEHVKENYVAWPRHDRRGEGRRTADRRAPDRRRQQLSEQRRSQRKYSEILLTREELKLIEDLYLGDV